MKSLGRVIVCLGFAIGLLVGLNVCAPEFLGRLGLDARSLLALANEQERERLRREELVTKDRLILDKLEEKRLVVKDLVDRRLTLREAAARFQALNAASPNYDWDQFRAIHPGRTDEERHCRQVLAAVRAYLGPNSSASRETLARLHTELEESIASS
jgi:hypothetical protein